VFGDEPELGSLDVLSDLSSGSCSLLYVDGIIALGIFYEIIPELSLSLYLMAL